jgi:hypothetical protein
MLFPSHLGVHPIRRRPPESDYEKAFEQDIREKISGAVVSIRGVARY